MTFKSHSHPGNAFPDVIIIIPRPVSWTIPMVIQRSPDPVIPRFYNGPQPTGLPVAGQMMSIRLFPVTSTIVGGMGNCQIPSQTLLHLYLVV